MPWSTLPTFVALVYNSLASKAFKSCLLAQVIDKTGRRSDHDSFISHYNDICKGQIRLEKADVIHPLIAEMDYDGEKLAMESAARIPPLIRKAYHAPVLGRPCDAECG